MRIAEITLGLMRMTVPSSKVTSDHFSVDSATPTSLPSINGLVGVGNGILVLRSAIRIVLSYVSYSKTSLRLRADYPLRVELACFLVFAQRAVTAFLALSLRCSGVMFCLLYTSDAADEEDSVDLGGR